MVALGTTEGRALAVSFVLSKSDVRSCISFIQQRKVVCDISARHPPRRRAFSRAAFLSSCA